MAKKILKFVVRTVKLFFIVFLVYVASLFFRREQIPGGFIESICGNALPTNIVIHCKSASFGFGGGLSISGLKLYDLTRKDTLTPMFAAESISLRSFGSKLRIVGARFPRLQDSYYETGDYAEPLGYDDLDFRFPKIPKFRMELIRPDILGVTPEKVTAMVSSRPMKLLCSEIRIDWGDQADNFFLSGHCEVNLETRKVRGLVKGEATQSKIRPLIVALDLPAVLPYMDAFTEVTKPVPSSCEWDVDIGSNDFLLKLDLSPELGRYNGVSLAQADGKISLNVSFPVRDGSRKMDYETTVGPLTAYDNKDRPLKGTIKVVGKGDIAHLHCNAESGLQLKDLLNIIDYLNDGTMDCLVCETAPSVKVSGVLATDIEHQRDNDLRGALSFAKGSFFDIPLWDASAEFSYIGDTLFFNRARATGKQGGKVVGSAQLNLPDLDPDRATFSLDMTYTDGSVAELADFFKFDVGDKHGEVNGEISISGPISTNAAPRLNGHGQMRIKNGHLAQMRLFMGLTELLAKEVPGVDNIVNQSEGQCSFTIEDGIFKSDDLTIEGSLFSISANGTYNIPDDNLDFTVRVQLLKNESVLGKYLIRPILWPFSKLLLEFKATGSVENPDWEYISVLDRIM